MRYSSHERFKITYPYIHKNMYFKNYYKIRALSLLAHVVNIYIRRAPKFYHTSRYIWQLSYYKLMDNCSQ